LGPYPLSLEREHRDTVATARLRTLNRHVDNLTLGQIKVLNRGKEEAS